MVALAVVAVVVAVVVDPGRPAVVEVVALALAHLTPHFFAFCKLAISYFLKRVFATSKSAPLLASRDRGCPQSKPQISAASEGGNSSNLRPNVHVAAVLGTRVQILIPCSSIKIVAGVMAFGQTPFWIYFSITSLAH